MANPIRSIRELDFTPRQQVFPSPRDWRDVFVYFLLVDRFDDNRRGVPAYNPASAPRGRDSQQGKVFQGGNLKGILRRLNYIKGLGANAIWLSPVFKNRQEQADTYHGYGIQDFLAIDPRFGTLEDLQKLVKEAHARGLYVILDIILNHTGDNWAYPGDYPYYYSKQERTAFPFGFWRTAEPTSRFGSDDAVWPEELQRPECYKRRGQITNWDDPQEAIDGDFLSLKELDITRPDVVNALITAYKYWIALTDIDGFRIDTV
jgi:glycosidase